MSDNDDAPLRPFDLPIDREAFLSDRDMLTIKIALSFLRANYDAALDALRDDDQSDDDQSDDGPQFIKVDGERCEMPSVEDVIKTQQTWICQCQHEDHCDAGDYGDERDRNREPRSCPTCGVPLVDTHGEFYCSRCGETFTLDDLHDTDCETA